MGQRLNIEIWDKGQVLANAYYHWSGYTLSALELIEKIITNVDNLVECDNDRLKAVWLLQLTGAGLTQDELSTIFCKGFKGITDCKGRDDGLIAVSDKGIQDTRQWEEDRATIYLDERRIDFDVVFKQYRWEYDKEREDYGNPAFKELPIIDWNLSDIKFKDFENFYAFMEELEKETLYFRTKQYPCIAYGMISC
ncbi:MAG: hypothetical protein J6U00_00715 [Ruminococcus sp.]|uniref:hypothetical protein n=1 Tax=Ruminococcus sp. TaxID=41978 RepID=UPI001B198EF5|nr:hypothetical protein [Ruminococcus sp.]MBO7472521.1 hypothetical protein [Ruminococcus sp.]